MDLIMDWIMDSIEQQIASVLSAEDHLMLNCPMSRD